MKKGGRTQPFLTVPAPGKSLQSPEEKLKGCYFQAVFWEERALETARGLICGKKVHFYWKRSFLVFMKGWFFKLRCNYIEHYGNPSGSGSLEQTLLWTVGIDTHNTFARQKGERLFTVHCLRYRLDIEPDLQRIPTPHSNGPPQFQYSDYKFLWIFQKKIKAFSSWKEEIIFIV